MRLHNDEHIQDKIANYGQYEIPFENEYNLRYLLKEDNTIIEKLRTILQNLSKYKDFKLNYENRNKNWLAEDVDPKLKKEIEIEYSYFCNDFPNFFKSPNDMIKFIICQRNIFISENDKNIIRCNEIREKYKNAPAEIKKIFDNARNYRANKEKIKEYFGIRMPSSFGRFISLLGGDPKIQKGGYVKALLEGEGKEGLMKIESGDSEQKELTQRIYDEGYNYIDKDGPIILSDRDCIVDGDVRPIENTKLIIEGRGNDIIKKCQKELYSIFTVGDCDLFESKPDFDEFCNYPGNLTKNEKIEKFKHYNGVFCDIDGTLIEKMENGQRIVNKKVVNKLLELKQNYKITFWTAGDLEKKKKLLESCYEDLLKCGLNEKILIEIGLLSIVDGNRVWNLKNKYNYKNSIVEISLDDRIKDRYIYQLHIFPVKFINTNEL